MVTVAQRATQWMKLSRGRLVWIGATVLGVVLLALAFRASPVLVDVAEIGRDRLQVTVDDDGRTRVRERYTISAPIQGRLLRTPLDPGDRVIAADTVVAEFVPMAPNLLDSRTRAEAEARVLRAEAALGEAQARREQALTDLRFATTELARAQELFEKKVQSKEALDQRRRDEQRARQGLRAAEFAIQVATFEAEMARASLREVSGGEPAGNGSRAEADGRLRLQSPIDGSVLRVFEQSARALPSGTPILEVGNTGALEIVAEYLSQDAVRVRAGMPVEVRGFSTSDIDDAPLLRGEVRRVEPGGFTKVSALGVEEQRVNIVIDPVGDPAGWAALGDGYRVELRIILWEGENVLGVPTGALFRQDDAWATFVVDGSVARLRKVEIGKRSGLQAEVLSGLQEGERVILYPNELIADGSRVEPR